MNKFNKERIIIDPCGYNYVKVTPEEVFKWGGHGICNGCNGQFLEEELNLCFVLADCYCDKCFEGIKKRWSDMNKDDIEYDLKLQEEESLDWYKYHLDDEYREKKVNAFFDYMDDYMDDYFEAESNRDA